METKKQTAMEWLSNELYGFIHPEHGKEFQVILDKAIAMEKEQIVQAYEKGQESEAKQGFWTKGNLYYNETYGK